MWRGRILVFTLEWAALVVLWMLLNGKWDPTEFAFGCVAAAVATTASWLIDHLHRDDRGHFHPKPGWILQLLRLPKYAVTGTAEILKALGQQLFTRKGADSLVQEVPFEVGGDDIASQTRRGLAEVYTNCTPNFVILDIDRARGRLRYHQVVQGEVLEMTRKLGACP